MLHNLRTSFFSAQVANGALEQTDCNHSIEVSHWDMCELLDKMRKLGKKTGHWIWWAFPSKLPGRSEPSPSTHVTEETAVEVIAKAPKVWRALLECICDLVEKNGKGVLPSIDHRRVGHFVRFWSNVHESPPWLKAVLERLAPFYGSEPP